MLSPKYTANPKIKYNYSKNNYIPELLTVKSYWNGVNMLASHSYVALLAVVHQLCTTV